MDTSKNVFLNKSEVLNYREDILDVITDEISKILSEKIDEHRISSQILIPVGISNRHVHLTETTFHKLFGSDTKFEELRPLYQPGEFASKHTLTIAGPKQRCIENVRILGPLRKYDQVEVSLTDSIYLGIDPPIANSGELQNACPLTLIGPKSSVFLEKCAIIANRHIHMSPLDAVNLGVKSGDLCRVKILGVKSTILENVLVRVHEGWRLQIHLDTDDANAAYIRGDAYAEFLGKM